MLKALKRLSLRSLKGTGVFRLFLHSPWRRERLLILCYHGIAIEDEQQWNPALYLTAGVFRSRMEMLKRKGATVLPLGEGIERLYSGDLPPGSVAITFDDGFYDFYKAAFPVLKEYGFPATVYLTTYYCDYNAGVFDPMSAYLLWKGRGNPAEACRKLLEIETSIDLSTRTGRESVFTSIRAFTQEKNLSAQEKDQLLRDLARSLQVDYGAIESKRILHLMTPAEVNALLSSGIVDMELHTHRHRTPSDRGLFLREIRENRKRIEEIAGRPAFHFCYPSGVHKPEFLPWLKEEKVRSATTCEPGFATRETNPLLLPRLVDVSTLAPIEFEGWLCGASAFLPARR